VITLLFLGTFSVPVCGRKISIPNNLKTTKVEDLNLRLSCRSLNSSQVIFVSEAHTLGKEGGERLQYLECYAAAKCN